MYAGDPEKALLTLAEEDIPDDRREQLACFGDSNTSDGKYGVLRRLDNGRYAINFILFDKETAEKAHSIYTEQIPNICKTVESFIEAHREEYLAFPYLNRKTDMNLILWQQVRTLSDAFSDSVTRILKEKYFSGIPKPDRPFSIFGYVNTEKKHTEADATALKLSMCADSKKSGSQTFM